MKIPVLGWRALGRLGQSKLINLTVLVPVIGYAILFNEQIVQYFELSESLVPSNKVLSIDGKTRLYLIYFGLTALGVASILYSFLCPDVHREHDSVYEYMLKEKGLMYPSQTESLAEEIIKSKYAKDSGGDDLAKEIQFILKEESIADITQPVDTIRKSEYDINALIERLMFFYYEVQDQALYFIRMLIVSLFFIGFVFLAIPSIQVFISVVIGR